MQQMICLNHQYDSKVTLILCYEVRGNKRWHCSLLTSLENTTMVFPIIIHYLDLYTQYTKTIFKKNVLYVISQVCAFRKHFSK